MSIIGITAEYNPFHNGHLYMLERALEITGAGGAVSVMSGPFTQRGLPAVADKYTRAYAATASGIDVCIELPVIYATGAAGDFAMGAVSMFNALGCVDYLCFGAETDDLGLLQHIADILYEEPREYTDILKDMQKNGAAFPAARQTALTEICGANITEVIEKPNNILGIEYLLALKHTSSHMKPVIIKRKSAMYHDSQLTGKISSATAIRHSLSDTASLSECMPEHALYILSDFMKNPILTENELEPYLSYIIRTKGTSCADILDMTADMQNRLLKCPLPASYNDICSYLKTRNLTLSRVYRAMLHLILGIKSTDRTLFKDNGYIFYANLLSFKKASSDILREAAENVEIITKKADFIPKDEPSDIMWKQDILASELYNDMYFRKTGIKLPCEYIRRLPIA